jgi:hypothetical protein
LFLACCSNALGPAASLLLCFVHNSAVEEWEEFGVDARLLLILLIQFQILLLEAVFVLLILVLIGNNSAERHNWRECCTRMQLDMSMSSHQYAFNGKR